ncbi:stage III sporulation protein AA [Lachnospiraceae bacterium JLR.KK008]
MVHREEILGLFPDFLRGLWQNIASQADSLQEIRLRADKPVTVLLGQRECFLGKDGGTTADEGQAYRIRARELEAVLNHICRYSVYAYEEELRQGFLTVPGGHRIGVAGQAVADEDGGIRKLKHISYMNIRIAHEIIGAADRVMPYLYEKGRFLSGMIISPPGCGKTTMLRDIIRQVSDGNPYGGGRCVGVVDERSEIAGSYMGVAQNNIGIRTDVLDGCPKAAGMMMLIRSMSPKVVAVDEIGSMEDVQALMQVLRCGSSLIVTAHGSSMEEMREKRYIGQLLAQQEFRRFIVLGRKKDKCVVEGIFDEDYRLCSGY